MEWVRLQGDLGGHGQAPGAAGQPQAPSRVPPPEVWPGVQPVETTCLSKQSGPHQSRDAAPVPHSQSPALLLWVGGSGGAPGSPSLHRRLWSSQVRDMVWQEAVALSPRGIAAEPAHPHQVPACCPGIGTQTGSRGVGKGWGAPVSGPSASAPARPAGAARCPSSQPAPGPARRWPSSCAPAAPAGARSPGRGRCSWTENPQGVAGVGSLS